VLGIGGPSIRDRPPWLDPDQLQWQIPGYGEHEVPDLRRAGHGVRRCTAERQGRNRSVQYSSITVDSDEYAGGSISFSASLNGVQASLFRAYGDVGFNAEPPYGYLGTRITVDSLSQVAQDIASVGARTLRTWSSPILICPTGTVIYYAPAVGDYSCKRRR
jgi:hypothetical protein